MSYQGQTRSFAFGEPDGELYGTATVWDGGSCSTFPGPVRAEGNGIDGEWRLTGDGVELAFAPVGEAAELDLPDAGITHRYQLARVRGAIADRELDCAGQRSTRVGSLDGKRFGALRTVSGWFAGNDGLAVIAARPRRARGHDSELVQAVVIEDGVPVPVADPRLSSTYTADGVPARVGLELWIGEDEADQYARRAAGEALAQSAVCTDPPLRSELLRWHMQGRQGIGVYELLHTR
ncbi:MAG TPA: hypothetical protein VG295_03055 [Solirubrobacteraceae bacterium]|nr:hypothetical protein [Solirubrobacteraceae bacterium]